MVGTHHSGGGGGLLRAHDDAGDEEEAKDDARAGVREHRDIGRNWKGEGEKVGKK
jgi:hypothetical protein